MARKVVWAQESVKDLESIAEYIARDSHYYAASFVQDIVNAANSLGQLSERGRVVPEFDTSKIRELFVSDYRLIYLLEDSRIVILGIIHGKRDLTRLWKKL
ncbi:hypothetical protein A2276_05060 [candidate division WOR-1 bacterium RIFOXYA12_FULL_43_27]|nr:MAG: hypothetical protein A2276_05060 [candidate division WOR-1 bacterium RIFOXYA12_FULL_43_27]OGC20036.1 MAG: hypothetical protein A2292_03065 [candidate division WOR-1 bacterium RIFOXYB2_FULL_46_45]